MALAHHHCLLGRRSGGSSAEGEVPSQCLHLPTTTYRWRTSGSGARRKTSGVVGSRRKVMAARSTQVNVVNDTGFGLSLIGSDLSHGEWSSGAEPPGTV